MSTTERPNSTRLGIHVIDEQQQQSFSYTELPRITFISCNQYYHLSSTCAHATRTSNKMNFAQLATNLSPPIDLKSLSARGLPKTTTTKARKLTMATTTTSPTTLLSFIFLISCVVMQTPLMNHNSFVQTAEIAIGEQKCQPLDTPFCNIEAYLTVKPFNNTLGHTSLNVAIAELHKFAYLLKREPCKNKIQLFLCSLYVPVCVTSTLLDTLLLPCRDDCEEARQVCRDDLAIINLSWPEEWDCRKFNYHRDDKLCVINNARENQPATTTSHLSAPTGGRILASSQQQLTSAQSTLLVNGLDSVSAKADGSLPVDPKLLPYPVASMAHDTNETICTDDMFDCKLTEKDMKSFCIARSYVCDGHKDCVLGDGIGNDLDEVGCDRKCPEGQLHCDGKCISGICDGNVDCSDGTDERNCYPQTDWLNLIQVISFIIALTIIPVLLIIRIFVQTDKPKTETTYDSIHDDVGYDIPKQNLDQQKCLPNDPIMNTLVNEIDPHFEHTSPRCPIYDEPTYSTTRGDLYERVNAGIYSGYSGASSVYSALGQSHSLWISKDIEEPKAPPPTPTPQYATTPQSTRDV